MRAFVSSVVAALIIAVIAVYVLDSAQQTVDRPPQPTSYS